SLVRAAILILEAVEGLGFVRALVEPIDDPVAVRVLVGAAVVLLRARLGRALVESIDDAVAVRVLVGAAVVLLRARLPRAAVLRIEEPVAVGVARPGRRGRRRP